MKIRLRGVTVRGSEAVEVGCTSDGVVEQDGLTRGRTARLHPRVARRLAALLTQTAAAGDERLPR